VCYYNIIVYDLFMVGMAKGAESLPEISRKFKNIFSLLWTYHVRRNMFKNCNLFKEFLKYYIATVPLVPVYQVNGEK